MASRESPVRGGILPQDPIVVDSPTPVRPPPEAPAALPEPLQNPLAHLLAGLGTVASRPRVMIFLLAISVLMALPVALPVSWSAAANVDPTGAFPGAYGESVAGAEALDLAVSAPQWLLADWKRRDPGLPAAVANALAPLMLLASLFGLFVCAGWMHLAVRGGKEHSLMAFCHGGGEHFWTFLRTWVLGLALFAGATWLVWKTPGEWVMSRLFPGGQPRFASSEQTVRMVQNTRTVTYLILLLWVELVLDLGRASLVAGRRRSALLAILRGVGFLLREPWRVLLLAGAGFAVEVVWIAGVIALVEKFGWPLWLLALMLPMGRIALRGARQGGMASLYAETLRSRGGAVDARRGGGSAGGPGWRESVETGLGG